MEKFGFINIYKETSDDFLFVDVKKIQAIKEEDYLVNIQLVSGEWFVTAFNMVKFIELFGEALK